MTGTVANMKSAGRTVCVAILLVAILLAAPICRADDIAAPSLALPEDGVSRAAKEAAEDWSAHFEYTGIVQGNLRFRSPYSGANSLNPGNRARELMNFWGYFGRRLWEGGEVYFNPQFDQGFGLNKTTGLAGFPDAEAQKSGVHTPKFNVARLFLRQTFGLGGEEESVEPEAGQLAGSRDIARLTFTAGKISPVDLFDNNAYSHDSRAQFMNYALADAGTFDWGADQKGYSDGIAVELNQKLWALRAGGFLVPKIPNSRDLDLNVGKRGMPLAELEQRYTLMGAPGTLRLLGFADRAIAGSFSDALDDPARPPDIAATRKDRWKYGFILNLEQAINDDVGVFCRIGWTDGRSETLTYTDIDRTLSGGVSLRGTGWERPDDRIGLAGAINGLSPVHRRFFAAGGVGLSIGDGALNYGTEQLIEAYYSLRLAEPLALSFDYQFFRNPAYNRDRGPVSVLALRLHWER